MHVKFLVHRTTDKNCDQNVHLSLVDWNNNNNNEWLTMYTQYQFQNTADTCQPIANKCVDCDWL